MLNLPKTLSLMLTNLKAAETAARGWWSTMSGVVAARLAWQQALLANAGAASLSRSQRALKQFQTHYRQLTQLARPALVQARDKAFARINLAAAPLMRLWGSVSYAERHAAAQRTFAVATCALALLAGQIGMHRLQAVETEREAVLAEREQVRTEFAAFDLRGLTTPSDDARLVKAAFKVKPARVAGFAPDNAASVKHGAIAGFILEQIEAVRSEPAQLDCLAKAVYYEARSEPIQGQIAVAEVVMNRVNDSRYPKTVCGVVYQQGKNRDVGCQFTFTCDGSLLEAPEGAAWDRARDIALNVAMGFARPVTNHATHYHTEYVQPYWSAAMVQTVRVGQHIFYRFPKTDAEWAKAREALDAQQARDPDPAPLEVAQLDAPAQIPAPTPVPVLASGTAPAPAPEPVAAATAALVTVSATAETDSAGKIVLADAKPL